MRDLPPNHAVLTSGRKLAWSATWNLIGMVAPLLIGIMAMPLLIDGMGKERFGLLTIIWMGIGYFSLFDMGLGRAMTKLVAERLGTGNTQDLGSLIWTALPLIIALGFIGAMGVWWVAKPLIYSLFNIEPVLQAEAMTALRILSVGLPFVVLSAATIGLLEAHQRFFSIAAIRIPLGALTFAAPLISLQFTPSLTWATSGLLLARVGSAIAFWYIAAIVQPELRRPHWPSTKHIRPLFHFGGWLTVTNLIGPLMVYFDRFLIGSISTLTAVTYYVTPYEIVSRVQMIPQSLMGVLFPAMAAATTTDQSRLVILYDKAARIIFAIMLPIMATLYLLASEWLTLWLGPEFSALSTPVVQWLAFGGLINAMARPSLTVLQSSGHPDLVAKAHFFEFAPYAAILWFLTANYGISGTAAAWTLRVLADALILNKFAYRAIPKLAPAVHEAHKRIAAVALIAVAALFVESPSLRWVFVACSFGFAMICGWSTLKELLLVRPRSSCVI